MHSKDGNDATIIGPNYGRRTVNDTRAGAVRYGFAGENIHLENLVFDGANMKMNAGGSGDHWSNNYYFMQFRVSSKNPVLKDITIQNIGAGSNLRGIFDILHLNGTATSGERKAYREAGYGKYFINVTIGDGIKTGFMLYDLVNINCVDNLYFKNLVLTTTKGTKYPITITNSGTSDTNPETEGALDKGIGSRNVIFDGLTLPAGKQIRVQRYSSRNISLPDEYRYLQLRTNWTYSTTAVSSSAIEAFREEDFPTSLSSNTVFFDGQTNKYIVHTNFTLDTQFANLNSLMAHVNTNLACSTPSPNVMLIAKTDGTIPNLQLQSFLQILL